MTQSIRQSRLLEILISLGHVLPSQVDTSLSKDDKTLGESLVKNRMITAAQLSDALAEQYKLLYMSLDGYTVSPELFRLIPAAVCYQQYILPYRVNGKLLEVIVADPYDLSLPERLEAQHGLRVKLLLSSKAAIESALKRSEGESSLLKDMSEDFRLVVVKEGEDGTEQLVSLDTLDDKAGPVVRLVNTLLSTALTKRASDVHIETHEQAIAVKYRIDGVLYPATDMLDKRHHGALVSRLKVMAELDIAERRIPQDGRFRLRLAGHDIDFRLSIMPSVFGEDVVIRILDKSSVTEGVRHLRLDGLSMAPEVLKKFRRSIREPYGMVLITGPTGSEIGRAHV